LLQHGVSFTRSDRDTPAASSLALFKANTSSLDKDNDDDDNDNETDMFCPICFCEVPSNEMYALSCEHWFCMDCLCGYLSVSIKSDNMWRIPCPKREGCPCYFTMEAVTHIVKDESLVHRMKSSMLK
jgi:hypothetical protein